VPTIAVLGAGGVGGFVAAALARSGADVTIVGHESTVAALTEHGLSVRSRILGDFHARPEAVATLVDPPDVLVVATKATGLVDALDRIQSAPELVVPLLNGIEHLDVLRHRFGAERVSAAVIRIESDRPSPGEIVQTSPACRVDVATEHPALAAKLSQFADALQAAGIAVRTDQSESHVMWSKLARLCPLALTTSASDRPIGYVRSDPRWRSALDNAITETVAVANAQGAGVDPAVPRDELETAPPELGSSMQRDIAAGREPELDAIAGAVVRGGERYGVRCPTIAWLMARVGERIGTAGAA